MNGNLSGDFLLLTGFVNIQRSATRVAVASNLQFTVTVSRNPQRERVRPRLNSTHTQVRSTQRRHLAMISRGVFS